MFGFTQGCREKPGEGSRLGNNFRENINCTFPELKWAVDNLDRIGSFGSTLHKSFVKS